MADYAWQQISGVMIQIQTSRPRNIMQCIAWSTREPDFLAQRTANKIEYYAFLIHSRHSKLLYAFGFVDGCHLPVARAEDLDIENAYYNG